MSAEDVGAGDMFVVISTANLVTASNYATDIEYAPILVSK